VPWRWPDTDFQRGKLTDATEPEHIGAFATAPSLDQLPDVIDVHSSTPLNPPEKVQLQFVGASYRDAYLEANTFVTVADEFAAKHTRAGFGSLDRVIDFGSGWGRITRTLLTKTPATHLYALDVDDHMTAIINTTLPGVNAMTVSPMPPTPLATGAFDGVVAFSVFSHLSGPAHEAWAGELARVLRPGGFAAITVLDDVFFQQVRGAQRAVRAGEATEFAQSLATTFEDVEAAYAGYQAGQIQYAGTGGGDMRTGDYYGWAAAPKAYIHRAWGDAGLQVVEWVPSGVLFPQAMVFMVRSGGPVSTARTNARRYQSALQRRIEDGLRALRDHRR
jgi:SAM-dependent methyltransferase